MAEAQKSDNTEQVEQLQKKLAALTKIHNSSKDAHLQLQDDLAAHQEAANKHTITVAELDEQNRQLKEQIKSLDTQHNELVAECEKDEHRIHELENEVTNLKHQLEIATASGSKSDLQDLCSRLEQENKDLHTDLTRTKEENETSSHKQLEMQKALESKIADLESELKTLQAQLAAKTEDLQRLSSEQSTT